MHKLATVIVRELKNALPATLFFLVLFHLLGITKAVVEGDHSFTGVRSISATIGALIVGKAIITIDALPIARVLSPTRLAHVFWKASLYGLAVLVFKTVEEMIHALSEHGSLRTATHALLAETHWPIFAVLSAWVAAGLVLYCLATELVQHAGVQRTLEFLRGPPTPRAEH